MVQDESYTDALFNEVDNMVIEMITTLDLNAYITASLKSTEDEDSCFSVTVDHPDSTHFPKVVTIDYGEGCTIVFRDDTITRKGQIIITITDRCFMEGTRTITNLDLNEQFHLEMDISLEGGKVTFPDDSWISRDAEHVREWIRDFNPNLDTFKITRSASGINLLGEEYDRVITEPLVLIH